MRNLWSALLLGLVFLTSCRSQEFYLKQLEKHAVVDETIGEDLPGRLSFSVDVQADKIPQKDQAVITKSQFLPFIFFTQVTQRVTLSPGQSRYLPEMAHVLKGHLIQQWMADEKLASRPDTFHLEATLKNLGNSFKYKTQTTAIFVLVAAVTTYDEYIEPAIINLSCDYVLKGGRGQVLSNGVAQMSLDYPGAANRGMKSDKKFINNHLEQYFQEQPRFAEALARQVVQQCRLDLNK